MMQYETVIAASDNDAYNTLVATELAPEFGRDRVFQLRRRKSGSALHHLPRTLGGKPFGPDKGHDELERLADAGWSVRCTRLSDEYDLHDWRAGNPQALLLGAIAPSGAVRMLREDSEPKVGPGYSLIALRPPDAPDADIDAAGASGKAGGDSEGMSQ